jgi:hypothetical protein
VNALAMSGKGYISARGGFGGNSQFPGGGGGGGVVSLFNYQESFQMYSFTGYVDVNGGNAGVIPAPQADSFSLETSLDGGDAQHPYAAAVARNLRLADARFASNSISPATAGKSGVAFLPVCKAGYGNDADTGAICEECPVGTYSLGDSSGPCLQCTNAPTHSHYLDAGETDPDCPYACDAGYVTNHCYNQFQNFIYAIMGVPAFAGMCVGIFLVLMGPLTYQRLKRKYGWFSEESYMKAKKKKREMFGLDFFARNQDADDDSIFDTSHGKGDKMIKMQKFTTENPVLRAMSSDPSRMSTESEASSTRIRPLRNKMFAERRREHRMNDQDLIFHAYRINLLGSNHPLQSKGTFTCSFSTDF